MGADVGRDAATDSAGGGRDRGASATCSGAGTTVGAGGMGMGARRGAERRASVVRCRLLGRGHGRWHTQQASVCMHAPPCDGAGRRAGRWRLEARAEVQMLAAAVVRAVVWSSQLRKNSPRRTQSRQDSRKGRTEARDSRWGRGCAG